jgi:hypothetical protein
MAPFLNKRESVCEYPQVWIKSDKKVNVNTTRIKLVPSIIKFLIISMIIIKLQWYIKNKNVARY